LATRQSERLVAGQPADAPQQRRQILTVDVLHRDEQMPVDFADVVQTAHVRMGDVAPDSHLVNELLLPLRESLAGREELQRHRLSELQVVGAVDLTHATLA